MSGMVTLRTNEPVNLVNEGRHIDADLLGLQYLKQSTEEVELINWELVHYKDTTIKLQLNFTEPLLVSADTDKDLVEIWVAKALLLPEHNPYIFIPIAEAKQKELEEDMILWREGELPVQVINQGKLKSKVIYRLATYEVLKTAGEVIGGAMFVAIVLPFLLQVVM